jgi:hypothetical protein
MREENSVLLGQLAADYQLQLRRRQSALWFCDRFARCCCGTGSAACSQQSVGEDSWYHKVSLRGCY